MSEPDNPVLTVGHSSHTIDDFIGLIKGAGITAIADVRSAPYSRFQPQFNKEQLERSLKEHGVAYVFLGRELGARSDEPSCYIDGRVQYDRLAALPKFKEGVRRVLDGARKRRVALMCAEREPLDCHRTLLVGRALVELGSEVAHLHADGVVEPHGQAMRRLVRMVGLPEDDLFRSHEELVAEALSIQSKRVAYQDEKMANEAGAEHT